MAGSLTSEHLISYGRYKCIKKIGKGGMSDVFLCTDTNIGKKWAMKVIKLSGSLAPIAKSEITLLKSLDHATFPRITDAFVFEDKICIVTDYIEGRTLSSIIRNEGRLPSSLVAEYFLTLIRALIYLHSMTPPVLYLDMKPSNIMIKSDGTLQLIDFGIAQTILKKGRGYGSIGYSPPEQYMQNATLDERSDVYALGMTMYALLSGEEASSNHIFQLNQIKNDRSIDVKLKNIILKCVTSDISLRPYPCEVERMLMRLNRTESGIRIAAYETAFIGALFVLMIFFLFNTYKKYESRKYADEMLDKASEYVTDSGYTAQGIKIICAYIDGNFLDDKTEEYFTYEAAKNYFEVQRDYLSAKRYFERLPVRKYPEVEYYIRLCKLLTGFEKDKSGIDETVKEFRAYNASLSDSDIKRKNEEMLDLVLKEVER